jgi:hypothetical protein
MKTVDQKVTNKPTSQPRVRVKPLKALMLGLTCWTLYQPIQELSLYGSYSKSFTPAMIDSQSLALPLNPNVAKVWSWVKAELLNSKLFATLAYFDITKQIVASADPNFPERNAQSPQWTTKSWSWIRCEWWNSYQGGYYCFLRIYRWGNYTWPNRIELERVCRHS